MRERDLFRRERACARKACEWLVDVPSGKITAEQQIQRIFAVSAFDAAAAPPRPRIDLRKLAAEMPEFAWHRCPGDPFFAVATHRLLTLADVHVESLSEFAHRLSEILFGVERNPAATPLWASLLLTNPGAYLSSIPKDKTTCPGAQGAGCSSCAVAAWDTLCDGGSEIVAESCRALMHGSACGAIPIPASHLHTALPMLCVSYARSFDIQTVCRLLRGCAYLGVAESIQCRWAREWLLFQQQQDGRVGLLDLEAQRGGWSLDVANLYFLPSVEAVWTLAELSRPGFLLSENRSPHVPDR